MADQIGDPRDKKAMLEIVAAYERYLAILEARSKSTRTD